MSFSYIVFHLTLLIAATLHSYEILITDAYEISTIYNRGTLRGDVSPSRSAATLFTIPFEKCQGFEVRHYTSVHVAQGVAKLQEVKVKESKKSKILGLTLRFFK